MLMSEGRADSVSLFSSVRQPLLEVAGAEEGLDTVVIYMLQSMNGVIRTPMMAAAGRLHVGAI